jgi:beclin 1
MHTRQTAPEESILDLKNVFKLEKQKNREKPKNVQKQNTSNAKDYISLQNRWASLTSFKLKKITLFFFPRFFLDLKGMDSSFSSSKELMVCQGCFKLIKLDYSLLAADISLLNMSKLAHQFQQQLQQQQQLEDGAMISQKSKSLSNINLGSSSTDTFPNLRSSEDLMRFRSVSMMKSAARSTSVSRLAFFSKMSSLFSEASEQTALEQPLCRECYKRTETVLGSRVAEFRQHSSLYRAALKDVTGSTSAEANLSSEDLLPSKEEQELEQELRELETGLREATAARKMWEGRLERAQELSELFVRARNELACEASSQEQQLHATAAALQMEALHMQRLSRAAVLNEVFHIWYDGHFGCINGLRLGRLPSVPVDWTEINGCWGLAVSLLCALSQVLGLQFADWQPLPGGVSSRMLHKGDGVAYELNGSSDVTLGRLFWYRKFDLAITGFLACVEQLVVYITRQDPSFLFPYVIAKDRIGPSNGMLSVRYQFSEEASWTRALKFVLTTLKYVVAFVNKRKLEQNDLSKR